VKWAAHVARTGSLESVKIVFRGPEDKRPIAGTRRRWENNIKMYVMEIGSAYDLSLYETLFTQVQWLISYLQEENYEFKLSTALHVHVSGFQQKFP
jgi:hypothetical protein